jgi:hypothetical protein
MRSQKSFLMALAGITVVSGAVALAQGRGSFTPTNWKPPHQLTGGIEEAYVTVEKIGPPTWSYTVQRGL